jgi:hypothetical protein
MTLVYVLLVAHFVGDFVYQTDDMAVRKATSWWALALHVLVYTFVLLMFTVWWWEAAIFCAVNGVAHFVQDAVTSRILARLWFLPVSKRYQGGHTLLVEDTGSRHWFFVAIGADQLLHYVTLFVTADWWLR